ncbi:sce7726 family protein [Vibrio fluvialis]|nr:sce7726 family protein [Vibrio fluvialis]MBY8070888.1 sce7726 family protein [Vibrio fluvialis]
MNDERIISCKLIDYLEKVYDFDFIAREVPFSLGERRADLVAASKKQGVTYAFEIKSDSDTLTRLKGQLEAYRTTFNYVNVVTTHKYLSAVKQYGLWFGILLINEDGVITEERKPRKRLLSNHSYDRPLLKEYHGDYNRGYVEWLCQRYEPLYDLFVKERTTSATTIEDIKILSLRSDRITIL